MKWVNHIFNNSGRKLKTVVKICFAVVAVASVLVGIAVAIMFINDEKLEAPEKVMYFVLSLAGIPSVTILISWLSSLPMAAFAELVENSYDIKQTTKEGLEEMKKRNDFPIESNDGSILPFVEKKDAVKQADSSSRQGAVSKTPKESFAQPEPAVEMVTCDLCQKQDLFLLPIQVEKNGQTVKMRACYDCKRKRDEARIAQGSNVCPRCGKKVRTLYMPSNVNLTNGEKVCELCLGDLVRINAEDN